MIRMIGVLFVSISMVLSCDIAAASSLSSKDRKITQFNTPVMPILFERNIGQRKDDTEFISRTQAGIVLLETGSVFILPKDWKRPIRISFEKSDLSIGKGKNPSSAKINYFKGKDQSRWLKDVPVFRAVHYDDIYPGIDLVFHGKDNQLEYDLTIQPGIKHCPIVLKIENAKDLRLQDGDLYIVGDVKELIHHAPVAYQVVNGRRIGVDAKYEILSGHRVNIALGKYDHQKELVIDPSITYSTYLGGTSWDRATDLIADPSGNPIVYGQTSSVDFPLMGAIDPTLGGGQDLFVAKLNNVASDLIFSTYIGGSNFELSTRLTTDATGNIYLGGGTFSSDFPVTAGAYDTVFNSATCGPLGEPCSDGFVTKIDPIGSTLVYSTFLGGNSNIDGVGDVAVDSSMNVYVTGSTAALDFPTTVGAFQTIHGDTNNEISEHDAYITKLNDSGSSLVYSTFIGGLGTEFGNAISVDTVGNAHITGAVAGFDFPLQNPIQSENMCEDELQMLMGSPHEAFVTKLNPVGSALVFSTYLGGCGAESFGDFSGEDIGKDISVASDGTIYVMGSTTSNDPEPFPTTPNAYDPGDDLSGVFLTRMSAAGDSLVYSTTLGENVIFPQAMAAYSSGGAYIVGSTTSSLLNVRDAIQPVYAGGGDGFIAKLDTNGSGDSSLLMLTYMGGTSQDDIFGIFGDGSNIYITGQTSSIDYPTTPGVFQEGFQTPPPLFDETFNDPIMGWELKGSWNQENGDLVVTTDSRATAFSPFAGCNNCTAEAEILMEEEDGKAFLIGWSPNKKDQILLTLKNIDADSGKVILKQKAGGGTVFKSKQDYPIVPGHIYNVKVTVSGTNIIVLVDGVEVFNVNSSSDPKDTGDFGFKGRGIGGEQRSYRFGRLTISAGGASDPGSAFVTKIAD